MTTKMKDLDLSYRAAVHGVQTALKYEIESGLDGGNHSSPKHLRTGIDSAHSSIYGLAALLMDKGVFTLDEYKEYIRLAMNDELARLEAKHAPLEFR